MSVIILGSRLSSINRWRARKQPVFGVKDRIEVDYTHPFKASLDIGVGNSCGTRYLGNMVIVEIQN